MTKTRLEGCIVAIKLISGEEIIARVVVEQPSFLSLSHPLSFIMHPNPTAPNQAVVSFAPWMIGIHDTQIVTILMDKIIFAAEARGDASDQYRQAIGEFNTPPINHFNTDSNVSLDSKYTSPPIKTGASKPPSKGIDQNNIVLGKTNPRG